MEPWFYQRTFQMGENQHTLYYPDWALKFALTEKIDTAWNTLLEQRIIDREAVRADTVQNGEVEFGRIRAGTDVCILHCRHWRKDRKLLYGWPLTTVAASWLRAHQQAIEAHLGVAIAKAQFVRKYTTKGGSRAVDYLTTALASTLSSTNYTDRNPFPAAASSLIMNEAVTAEELPMMTGASDFKQDNDSFAWHAALGAGLPSPVMYGLDTARYATAVQMDRVASILLNGYSRFWATQFEKMATIVLSFSNLYGGTNYDTESTCNIDVLTIADFPDLVQPIGGLMDSLTNAVNAGVIPANAAAAIDAQLLVKPLQALGAANVSELTGDEAFEIGDYEEEEPESEPPPMVPMVQPEQEIPEVPEMETALRMAAQNYANGSIDADTLAEMVIADVVERRNGN